ncbi:MAG: alpha-glucosidase C-terminal domain-containing protein [Phycisphaerales bacterium]
MWVFLRQDATQQVLVALNASSKPATIDLSSLGSGWKSLHGGDAGGAPGSATVTVPPVSGRVWAK